MESPQIGVLDLQGGVVEHVAHFDALGVTARRVKQAADFDGLQGLVIPGGESTCLARLLVRYGLEARIRDRYDAGLKLWGTCAGAILLAREVEGGEPCLRLLDIRIRRNAFGSQLASFNRTLGVPAVDREPIPLTFIRAPKILALGAGVLPLLAVDDYYAAARDARTLVTVFHPELTPSLAFHRYFVRMCGIEVPGQTADAPAWRTSSWAGFAPIP